MTKTVSQHDREAAASLMRDQKPLWSEHIDDLLAGNNDSNAIVQAFAHHAEQARLEERERAAKIADAGWHPSYVAGNLSDPGNWKPGSPYDRGQVDAAERIANAIRKDEAA